MLTAATVFTQSIEVTGLEIEGNHAISDGKLKKVIQTREPHWYHFILFWKGTEILDESVFLNDLLRIEQLYHQQGFLDARIKDYRFEYNNTRDAADIHIMIEEGKPTLVDSVFFVSTGGDTLPVSKVKLRKLITQKKGKRYRRDNLRLDYHRIMEIFDNSGYPYIKVRVRPDIRNQADRVNLTWLIESGPYSRFGKITIEGNTNVSDRVILRGIDFAENEPFEQKKLMIAQSRIYRLEIFQYVDLQTVRLEQHPPEIPVHIRVKERNLQTLNFGAGYGTEEGYRMTVDWTNRNFVGGARILRVSVKRSATILPLDVNLELSQPFFFDDQNDLVLQSYFTWQNEKGYEARRLGFETTFNRQLSIVSTFSLTSRTERDSVRIKSDTTKALNNIYNKSVLMAAFNRNTTDQIFTPSYGSLLMLIAEESGRLFSSRFRFYKISAEYRRYYTIDRHNVIAVRLFAGMMKPYGQSRDTPVEERFFSGGSNSVRGWARQQLGPHVTDPSSGKRIPVGGNSKLET